MANIGYARVSTADQDPALQLDALAKADVAIRERDGRILTSVFPSEDASVAFIKARIAKGATVHADEAACWFPRQPGPQTHERGDGDGLTPDLLDDGW